MATEDTEGHGTFRRLRGPLTWGRMRIWPEGAWFGLNKRVRWRVLVCAAAASLFCYVGLWSIVRSIVLDDAHRSTQLVDAVARVKLGDSEQSVLPMVRAFDLRRENGFYTRRLAPLWQIYGLGRPFVWAVSALPSELRKRTGLRLFETSVDIQVEAHEVVATSVRIIVEGRDEMLGVEWLLTRWMPEHRSPSSFSASAIWGYGGDKLSTVITPNSPEADVAAARNINLKCLTSYTGCASLAELAPDAARRLRK